MTFQRNTVVPTVPVIGAVGTTLVVPPPVGAGAMTVVPVTGRVTVVVVSRGARRPADLLDADFFFETAGRRVFFATANVLQMSVRTVQSGNQP